MGLSSEETGYIACAPAITDHTFYMRYRIDFLSPSL